MKTEDIFKLLNQGKRDVYDIKKPKKYTFKSVLYSFTGKTIKKVTEFVTDALKHDLTIEFKPVLPFRRKDLKGVDVTTLKNEGGTHTLQDKEDLSTIDKSYKEVLFKKNKSSDNEFVNWFDVTSTEKPKRNTRCTYTDKYGNTTSLDESYEQLKRQSD
tara:strand:+ start:930 stop:1403 length:474 start_codon:yes stop_codon:yes gene_type:complete